MSSTALKALCCCMQNLLQEHLGEMEGMEHMATIHRPFSDEHAASPAERDAQNVAFLERIKAATHEVTPIHVMPAIQPACPACLRDGTKDFVWQCCNLGQLNRSLLYMACRCTLSSGGPSAGLTCSPSQRATKPACIQHIRMQMAVTVVGELCLSAHSCFQVTVSPSPSTLGCLCCCVASCPFALQAASADTCHLQKALTAHFEDF